MFTVAFFLQTSVLAPVILIYHTILQKTIGCSMAIDKLMIVLMLDPALFKPNKTTGWCETNIDSAQYDYSLEIK